MGNWLFISHKIKIARLTLSSTAELVKHVQIKEVHATQNQNDSTNLDAESFHGLLVALHRFVATEHKRGIANVDQVEAREQKLIHGISELLIAVEDVDQECAAVFEERARHPHRELWAAQAGVLAAAKC